MSSSSPARRRGRPGRPGTPVRNGAPAPPKRVLPTFANPLDAAQQLELERVTSAAKASANGGLGQQSQSQPASNGAPPRSKRRPPPLLDADATTPRQPGPDGALQPSPSPSSTTALRSSRPGTRRAAPPISALVAAAAAPSPPATLQPAAALQPASPPRRPAPLLTLPEPEPEPEPQPQPEQEPQPQLEPEPEVPPAKTQSKGWLVAQTKMEVLQDVQSSQRWDQAAASYGKQVRRYSDYRIAALKAKFAVKAAQAVNVKALADTESGLAEAEGGGRLRRNRTVTNSLGVRDETVEGLGSDPVVAQARYVQLLKALEQKNLAEALSRGGFPDEAEFRLQCCVAEFCEEAGYDPRFIVDNVDYRRKVDLTRMLDRVLYFGPTDQIPGVEKKVPGRIETAYHAYAHLAYIRYKRAEEHYEAMRGLMLRTEEFKREETRYEADVKLASQDLKAWIAFLEELRDRVRLKRKSHPEESSTIRPRLPDKAVILTGSRLLLLSARHAELTGIELAEDLYDVGKDWLDFSQHDTFLNQSWTIKRLLRDVASRLRAEAAAPDPVGSRLTPEEKLELADKNWELSNKMPNLLRVTTVGGWTGDFKSTHSAMMKKLWFLALIMISFVLYYVDIILDCTVLVQYYEDEGVSYSFTASICFILVSIFIACFLDRYMHHIDHAGVENMETPDDDERYRPADRRGGRTLSDAEELEEKLEEERKRRDLPIQSRPLWVRCVLNVTMLRMCDEVYWAFLAWHHGRVPAAAFDQVRAVEGLFEAGPQSLILSYDLVLRAYLGTLTWEEHWVKILSCTMSFMMCSVSLSMLGQNAQVKWRACFGIFCLSQVVLRVVSIMGAIILVIEHCDGPSDDDSRRFWVQPNYCGTNSSGVSPQVLIAAYLSLTMFISVVYHVVHLQGLSGGSLVACTRLGHHTDQQRQDLDKKALKEEGFFKRWRIYAFRLTIANEYALTTWIIGLLNIFIAFDCSPFSVLKNADPRPPRLKFFLFRLLEIGFSCFWIEYNLRADRKYILDFDAVAMGLLMLTVTMYLVCLLVPYAQREGLAPSTRRAVSTGLAADTTGVYRANYLDILDKESAGSASVPGDASPRPGDASPRQRAPSSGMSGDQAAAEEAPQRGAWETPFVLLMMAMVIALGAVLAASKVANKNVKAKCWPPPHGPCLNGGRCLQVDDDDRPESLAAFGGDVSAFHCECPPDWTGTTCEYPSQTQLAGWTRMSGCNYSVGSVGGNASSNEFGVVARCNNGTAEPAFTHLWHGGFLYHRLPWGAASCGAVTVAAAGG